MHRIDSTTLSRKFHLRFCCSHYTPRCITAKSTTNSYTDAPHPPRRPPPPPHTPRTRQRAPDACQLTVRWTGLSQPPTPTPPTPAARRLTSETFQRTVLLLPLPPPPLLPHPSPPTDIGEVNDSKAMSVYCGYSSVPPPPPPKPVHTPTNAARRMTGETCQSSHPPPPPPTSHSRQCGPTNDSRDVSI